MTTVSAWWRSRSRTAEVMVLSLLKIEAHCLQGQEVQAEEVLDLEPIDFLGPVPVELFEGFQDREAGGLDAQFDGVLAALLVLAVDEAGEVIGVGPGMLGGLLGPFGVMGLE